MYGTDKIKLYDKNVKVVNFMCYFPIGVMIYSFTKRKCWREK